MDKACVAKNRKKLELLIGINVILVLAFIPVAPIAYGAVKEMAFLEFKDISYLVMAAVLYLGAIILFQALAVREIHRCAALLKKNHMAFTAGAVFLPGAMYVVAWHLIRAMRYMECHEE